MQLAPTASAPAGGLQRSATRADVIDLATRKSVDRDGAGDDPEAFDLSPDGKTLYVSNEDEGIAQRGRPRQRQAR